MDFPIKNGDFPIKNGDFPIKNGDFPIKNGDFPIKNGDLPSGYVNVAIENGHRKFVNFPINSMVDLSSSLCNKWPGRVQHVTTWNQNLWGLIKKNMTI